MPTNADLSLAEVAEQCQDGFSELHAATCWRRGQQDDINGRLVDQIRERFQQWTNNVGAMHPQGSPVSLEHRLFNSPRIRQSMLKMLNDLSVSIQDGTVPLSLSLIVDLLRVTVADMKKLGS